MNNPRAQQLVFAATSQLTDCFPVSGARLLDSVILPVMGSRPVAAIYAGHNRRVIERMRSFRRFLVIPDIHLGDAVMTQASLTALRDFFPAAEIDYVINRTIAPVIEGNPDATRVLPIFSSSRFPSVDDLGALRRVIRQGGYDLCLSFSSFLEKTDVGEEQPFVNFLTHSAAVLHAHRDPTRLNHISYQFYQFVHALFSMVRRPVRPARFEGVRVTFDDDAIARAVDFATTNDVLTGAPVIMVNPDAASRFTRLPFADQVALLTLLERDTGPETRILLGAGHTSEGIGQQLLDAMPPGRRARFTLIPRTMPLAVFGVLIDFADVFVTGDTGPLHLATARRYSRSGNHEFRNRTAVLSLFGATVPRMSGYDSRQPGFFAGNQDAPAWCYQAESPCRNITCLNKYFKTCRRVRCFERVDVAALATLISAHVGVLQRRRLDRRELASGGPVSARHDFGMR